MSPRNCAGRGRGGLLILSPHALTPQIVVVRAALPARCYAYQEVNTADRAGRGNHSVWRAAGRWNVCLVLDNLAGLHGEITAGEFDKTFREAKPYQMAEENLVCQVCRNAEGLLAGWFFRDRLTATALQQ